MEVYCKRCNRNMSSEGGLCRECKPNSDKSQGFLRRFSHLYDAFRGLTFKRNESINSSRFDSKFKENKRPDGILPRMKSIYKNVAEYGPEESDQSESTNFLEPNGQNDQSRPLEWSMSTLNRDMSIVKRVTWADQGEESNRESSDFWPPGELYDPLEQGNKYGSSSYRSISRDIDEDEQDMLRSFSSLGLRKRNDELERIDDEIWRYKDRENRLKERLLENDHKPDEYDYLPKIGDRDDDLWHMKPKDEETEYLKLLFFRESELRKYGQEELQKSMNRAINCTGKLVERFGIEINRINIKCLFDTNWLNDEIINFYLQMLQENSDRMRAKQKLPSCYFFNTFFFPTLCGNDAPGVRYDYKAVARWTKRRKVNIFEKDLLIVPVHVSKVHWALGVIDMRKSWRRMMMFDSLGGKNPRWFRNMRRWLMDEHKDKLKKPLQEIDEWKIPMNYTAEPYAPSQENTYDCGVFLCQFAKSVAFATGFSFAKESSSYLRNSMVHEILSGKVEV
ncbi:ulp1 peptidase [Theileria orientalis]|uniref:Ulp1 peptidase n=1 Tax=Theileria orientalis TaxID=68886 RepID=A0A976SL56_THEOR|nr:ulp1 peptidase [Theileria orientalis]